MVDATKMADRQPAALRASAWYVSVVEADSRLVSSSVESRVCCNARMSGVPCPHVWTQARDCVPHSELVPARKAHVHRIPIVVSVVSFGRVAPGGAKSSDSGPGSLQSENGRTPTEISQRQKNVAELGKVLVLSASTGAGHLRAAQAVERALIGMGAVREVRHIDVLEYTNKLFRNFYSKAYIEMVNTMSDVLGWLYDYLDKPWKNERGRLAFDKLNTRPFVKHAPGHRRYGFRHPCDVARASFRALFRGLGRNTR